MSKENLATDCKQRYKGVENFLRRVAFNLGNTPSQTEVKIISCIPIDVTDLQQKIVELEKQLEEAKTNVSVTSHKRTSAVHTALCCSNYPHLSSVAVPSKGIDCACGQSNNTIKCVNCSTTYQMQSTPSLLYPDVSSNNQDYLLLSTEMSNKTSEEFCKSNFCRKNLFRKRKKAPKKKVNSQMVYYAQPNNGSPFINYDKSDSIPKDIISSENKTLSRSYLSDVIRKQYNPGPIVKEYSNSSQFSSPVCRDIRENCKGTRQYESDVCSCCHGRFQNIDNYITHEKYSDPFWTYTQNVGNNSSAYYDSSLYDLVPVKEKAAKVKKESERKRREPQREVDIKCWPENVRAKQGTHPLIVNYYTTTPAKRFIRRIPVKLQNRREFIVNKTAAKRPRRTTTLHEPSTTSNVELGKVYSKRFNVHKPNQSQRMSVSVQPIRNNSVECSKTTANNTECQTTPVNPDPPSLENKTETTLNQIKSILQSVLTEVKTNSILKNVSEVTTKKDVIVQKELSQSNMQGSRILQSFTYSPYDINPNVSTCSRRLASGHLCYSGIPHSPVKCMPHYPLFVQTPRQNMCNNCFRYSSYITKPPPMKAANSAATNTEEIEESGRTETEKLIKEIYKSMALTMQIPTKETSTSEYDDLKSTDHDYKNHLFRSTLEKEKAASISSIFKKDDFPDTSVTPTPNTTNESKLPTNEISKQSNFDTTDTDQQKRRDRIEQQNKGRRTETTDTETEGDSIPHEREIKQNKHLAESDDDTDTTSTERDDTIIPVEEPVTKIQKKQKRSLLGKMLKLFKPREKNTMKTKEIQNELEDESKASDSDDYQTVYSHKIVTPKQNQHNIHKTRPHSKIYSSKQIQHRRHANHSERSPEGFRKMPYMEQEYRRYWEEKLSFHEDLRHSSEKFSRGTTSGRRRPLYYQNYEATSAIAEPDRKFAADDVKLRHANIATDMSNNGAPRVTAKGLAWLKKHNLGIHCGEQWKNIILEG